MCYARNVHMYETKIQSEYVPCLSTCGFMHKPAIINLTWVLLSTETFCTETFDMLTVHILTLEQSKILVEASS